MQKYYEKQNATLFHGNCIEILNHLNTESIDMIFADPPYMLSNDGISCQNGKVVSVNKGKWDKSKGLEEDFHFHNQWIQACQRVLKPHGTIWISGTYHSIYICGFLLQRLGFKILNDICWFKPNAAPNMSCRYFTASHETLLWAKKDPKGKHIFHYDLMKNGFWPGDDIKKNNKQMRSVWQINTPKKSEKTFGKHPTQKPLELLRRVILASTHKEDLVLDPFTGSSTTGVMALELERAFIGIDIEKDYLDLSIKRFEHIDSKHKGLL
ncbi:MAG: site-specific DNA-methyltransferase [Acetobacter sp.]|nr:site-specific DNA-methyltransferase [Acetobacter sp.]